MNMKKTIAALSAAAVAVSAMATTVSAEETNGGSLVYNLVKEVENEAEGTAVLTAEASGLTLDDTNPVVITVANAGLFDVADVEYTITVTQNDTAQVKVFSGITSKNSSMVNATGTDAVITIPTDTAAGIDTTVFDANVRISVVAKINKITAGKDQDDFNAAVVTAKTLKVTFDPDAGANSVDVAPMTVVTVADKTKDYYPMQSTLTGVVGNAATGSIAANAATDVVNYLSNGTKSYVNVLPVINDAIANYDNVTFTFTSSALKLDANGKSVDKDEVWSKPTFGQHLYGDAYYTAEDSGFVSTTNPWAFNLFSGGLSVNNGYTMSLNDTDVFDYGANTISFDWDSIAGGKVTNAKTILVSMQLYTSTQWYWDTMTVAYSNDSSDDAESGEGVEGEDEIVEEETEDEEVAEDEEVTEDTEEAPAEETNPATGNASVALAVIPVALAAAAIVAKKRK